MFSVFDLEHQMNLAENLEDRSLEAGFYIDQLTSPPAPSYANPKPVSCEVCQQMFADSSVLVSHMVVSHGDEKVHFEVFQGHAPKVSRRKRRSGRARQDRLPALHAFRPANKPYACEVCTQRFAYKYELVTHMETHVVEETYSCNICNREFLEKEHLDAHLRSTTYDPSACDICGAKFPSWTLLSDHRLEHLSNELPS